METFHAGSEPHQSDHQEYSSQHLEQLNIGDWNQYPNGFAYGPDDTRFVQPAPFFQFSQSSYQTDSINGKGPMTQLLSQVHPASHVRAYNPSALKKSSRPGPANPIQGRKGRSRQTQPARTGQAPAKRQKTSPPIDQSGHSRCNSTAESIVSECCSSCPDTPPCDESDCCDEDECDMQEEAVVPCYEQSCEKPVCSSPCLTAGIRAVAVSKLPTQARTSNWLESQWVPQVSGDLRSNTVIQPTMNCGFDGHYSSTSASPAPTTPSMVHNMETPYSPNTGLPTPQYGGYPAQFSFNNQSTGVLASTAHTYNHSEWPDYPSNLGHAHLTNCLWNGCNEHSFMNEQQWLSHLHHIHIDPQMTFGCPIQSETCPSTMITNPVDHLQTAHGYNFDFGDYSGNGFSCPAPDCLPNQTFFTPDMFHNHFDHAHGIPAQGSLQCRLEACNTTFVDPQDLIMHISQHHKLPVTLPKDEVDASVSTETASILASLPTAGAKASISPISTPTPEVDAGFSNKNIVHLCKWKDGDCLCRKICTSEEALQKHIKHDHLEQLDKQSGYKCLWEGCGRDSKRGEKAGFTQRGKLERHMATHTGFKCCACEECGKTFSAEQSLRQHLLLHKGEKPWKCKHCGKGFPQQSACTIHERTHTKEKPLQCPTCGKCFSESSNLSKHRKIHGEKGLNNCDFPGCGKSFHRFDQLKRHRATHERQVERAKRRRSLEGLSEMGVENDLGGDGVEE